MSNVVQFTPRADGEWRSGEVRCRACKHQWVAVAPLGVTALQCPKCEAMRGVWADEVWVCNCGSQLFYVTRSGFECRACGEEQEF